MRYLIAACTIVTLWFVSPASPASAQLLAAKDAPIIYGHHHLNVKNLDAQKKFWVEGLGGVAMKSPSGADFIKFPNVLVFLRAQEPTGPTKGSTVNHVAFSVPNVRAMVDRLKSRAYRIVTSEEALPGVVVKDDIAQSGEGIAYVMGPDEVKVEIVQVSKQTMPIAYHHTHLFGPDREAMRAWYMKVFGATAQAGANPNIISAALPGGILNFTNAPGPVEGTKGRAFDHLGFEVKNLEAFCKRLEAQGMKLDVPYRYVERLKLGVAALTDPWGTYIEMNEGLPNFAP
jgi:catechol 2,3-dioxygenase-like lactoylglutathione lyase family enzyme